MKTNEAGLQLIKGYEKCSLIAYLPTPNDRWTIGCGSTFIDGRPVVEGDKISIEKAVALLYTEIEKIENKLNKLITIPVTSNQFSALVSLTYNIGIGAFSKSTLLRFLNKNKIRAAADEFLRWDKQKGITLLGLTRRRVSERNLFLKPTESTVLELV